MAEDWDNAPEWTEENTRPLTFAEEVKFLRVRWGMTQEQLSAVLQVPVATVRNWEQGRVDPDAPARTLIRLILKRPKECLEALQTGRAA